MKYYIITSIVWACFLLANPLQAQDQVNKGQQAKAESDKTQIDTDSHDAHSHKQNEIGFGGGAIYTLDHKAWGTGIHLHYFRTLKPHGKWSLGGGIERVWADGTHYTIGAGVKYNLIHDLDIGIIPGITFLKHHEEEGSDSHDHESGYETRASLHFEVVYNLFEWEKFHLGPAFDYSWSKDDSHFMLGIHGAYCF